MADKRDQVKGANPAGNARGKSALGILAEKVEIEELKYGILILAN